MGTSMNLNNSNIVTLIRGNMGLFDQFDKVYLFGSVLDDNKVPNDVDVLLIYSVCSDIITETINSVLTSLEELLGISIDLTVLSEEEERDIQFLNRISSRCYRLK